MAKKQKIGIVCKKIQSQTIRVCVVLQSKHPAYSKRIPRTEVYMVHDNQNRANRGDTVIIEETRPLSSRKHWSLNSILIKKENFEK